MKKIFIFVALLLCVFGLFCVNAEDTVTIGDISSRHISKLHTLYLKNSESKLLIDNGRLTATNGVVVGRSNDSSSAMASIGGGKQNKINTSSNYAGIGGGQSNEVKGEGGIIGGGSANSVEGAYAVVAGGSDNKVNNNGVVVGGNKNIANGLGVALGGTTNNAGDSDLVLGSGAKGQGKSFVWNAQISRYDGGQIDAKNGILIGTTKPISGVNLVVSGVIKLAGSENLTGTAGEIKVVGGCFYSYDGLYWNLINQSSNDKCDSKLNPSKTCRFGSVILQEGDQVSAYLKTSSSNCISERKDVNCNGGLLLYEGKEVYPYCFEY